MFRLFENIIYIMTATVLLSCASTQHSGNESDIVKFTILHTNDVHGHGWAKKDKAGVLRGGYPALSALVTNLRKQLAADGREVFLFSAGDINTGTPESDLLEGEPDFVAMNHIGFDAFVLGNHEFDHGLKFLEKQITWAKFPALSGNIVFQTKLLKENVKPTLILTRRNVKVGLFGLTTDSLKVLVKTNKADNFEVQDALVRSKQLVHELQNQGADIVVGLTHLGIDKAEVKDAAHARAIYNDDTRIMRENAAIHLIVGGHSHTLLKEGFPVDSRLVVQAGEKGQYLGRVDLDWNTKTHKVERLVASVIPVLAENGIDARLEKKLADMAKKVEPLLSRKLAKTEIYLDGDRHSTRLGTTKLGELICESFRQYTKADAAIQNSGGIRSSIEKGWITRGDVLRVLPFKNQIVAIKISGKDLLASLQSGYDHRNESGSFLQVAKIDHVIENDVVKIKKVGSRAWTETGIYLVAANDFLTNGGDFQSGLTQQKDVIIFGKPLDVVFSEFISKKRIIR